MTSRVGAKGQVVIPKAHRDRFSMHPGDTVAFREVDGALVVEKVEQRETLRGMLRGTRPTQILDGERRRDRDREDAHTA